MPDPLYTAVERQNEAADRLHAAIDDMADGCYTKAYVEQLHSDVVLLLDSPAALDAQSPTRTEGLGVRVQINEQVGAPSTASIWIDGVLRFTGRDHSADLGEPATRPAPPVREPDGGPAISEHPTPCLSPDGSWAQCSAKSERCDNCFTDETPAPAPVQEERREVRKGHIDRLAMFDPDGRLTHYQDHTTGLSLTVDGYDVTVTPPALSSPPAAPGGGERRHRPVAGDAGPDPDLWCEACEQDWPCESARSAAPGEQYEPGIEQISDGWVARGAVLPSLAGRWEWRSQLPYESWNPINPETDYGTPLWEIRPARRLPAPETSEGGAS